MLRLIERIFSKNDEIPGGEKIDMIAVISYGTAGSRLTRASRAVAEEALAISGGQIPLVWCQFKFNQDLNAEKFGKRHIFSKATNFFAGDATSSTDEAEAIIKTAQENNIDLKTIVVVAWSGHSRRDYLVWKYFLPNSRIYMKSVRGWDGSDPGNPMKLQRSWQKWLLVNMILFPFYKFLPGVGWFAKRNFHQPT